MAKFDIKQLQLNFDRSREDLKKAVDGFGKAAAELVHATTDNPEANPEVDDGMKSVRAEINRIVRILADQTGLDFHTMWVLAYHEHSKRTGYHAVAASGGKGTHLDQAQKDGQLPELKETVAGMLTADQYGPRTKR